MTGAKFIADTLQANGGDVLKTIGAYNGWSSDLTLVCTLVHKYAFIANANFVT